MPVEEKKDQDKYLVVDFVRQSIELARSRSPRLQPSVPAEIGDIISGEVARGLWTTNPEDGSALRASGDTLIEYLEELIVTRPHWLMPVAKATPEDEIEKLWTGEPNLTARGQRLKDLEAFCGSKAGALAMFKEEAAKFGVTNPFSAQAGTKSEERTGQTDHAEAAKLSRNPWAAGFNGTEEQRMAEVARIIKTGSRFAEGMAKAAGTTVGRPLRK